MNYIYDIVLNFLDDFVEFYEWSNDDTIVSIRKIRLYRISDKDYLNIKNNKVILSQEFMCNYESVGKVSNICLVSNAREVMGIKFDDKGLVTSKSDMLFDEELDALEIADICSVTTNVVDKILAYGNFNYMPRSKKKKVIEVNKYLDNLYLNHDISALKYLYYDIFEIDSNNINHIMDTLKNEEYYNKIYDIISISQKKDN